VDAVTAAISANTRTENVVVIKNGAYQGTELKANGDGYLQCMENVGNIYLVGEPGTMPIISGSRTDNWADEYPASDDGLWGTRLYLRFFSNDHVHMKNIDMRWGRTETHAAMIVFNKVISRIHKADATYQFSHFARIYAGDISDKKAFVSNFLTYAQGANAQTHPIYGQSTQDESSDPFLGFYGHTYLNNYVAYETRSPGQGGGGHTFKDIGDYITIRNSWFSYSKDPANPDFTKDGEMGVSLHAHQKAVIYNNDFYAYIDSVEGGNYRTLLFQPRAITDALGACQPSYFSWPNIRTANTSANDKSGWDCWENWNGDDTYGPWQSDKNVVYHGPNVAPYNYSATGTQGDEAAGPAPGPATFWDGLGDVSDPANDNAFWKFVSNCRFHTIPTSSPITFQRNCITSRTTAPYTTSGLDDKSFLPVPSNWVERTWLHACNNEWDNGFGELYNTDFQEPIETRYAYGKWETAVTTVDNITIHGGDIKEGVGANIAIPDDFKI